jgi:hypothetical protein
MNGKKVGLLLERFEMGGDLNDQDLVTLHDGLQFIEDFSWQQRHSPYTVYYGMKREAIERIQSARQLK